MNIKRNFLHWIIYDRHTLSEQRCRFRNHQRRDLCLKSSGYKEIRLGVDKGNPQSYSFWTKNKFTPIREDTYILMGLRI